KPGAVVLDRTPQPVGDIASEGRVFEASRQVDRREEAVGFDTGQRDANGGDGPVSAVPGAREVGRGQLRDEILIAVEAAEYDRLDALQVTGKHRGRHQAGWLGRSGRGGEEEIASERRRPLEPCLTQPTEQ